MSANNACQYLVRVEHPCHGLRYERCHWPPPTVPGQPSPQRGNYLGFQNRRCSSSGCQFAAPQCCWVPEAPKSGPLSFLCLSVCLLIRPLVPPQHPEARPNAPLFWCLVHSLRCFFGADAHHHTRWRFSFSAWLANPSLALPCACRSWCSHLLGAPPGFLVWVVIII